MGLGSLPLYGTRTRTNVPGKLFPTTVGIPRRTFLAFDTAIKLSPLRIYGVAKAKSHVEQLVNNRVGGIRATGLVRTCGVDYDRVLARGWVVRLARIELLPIITRIVGILLIDDIYLAKKCTNCRTASTE